jgi:hypothetical protein
VSRRLPRSLAAGPVATAALLLAAQLLGSLELLLPVVPLLLLLGSLSAGHYPGCEAAARLAERLASRSGRPARRTAARRRPRLRPARSAAHGGLLLALSLSGRAPPAAA